MTGIPVLRLLILAVTLASTAALAESWTGFLVDADCYIRDEQNARQVDLDTNHDRDFEVRQCAPTAKSRLYSIVTRDSLNFRLDPSANEKIRALLHPDKSKAPVEVSVEGSMSGNTVRVENINLRR